MAFDLTNTKIKDTYHKLTQISSSKLLNGIGEEINNLEITASNSLTSSYTLTASYALNGNSSRNSYYPSGW